MGRKDLNEVLIEVMTVDDLPEVHSIETAAFTTPWSETLFHNELCKPISISRVSRINGRVAGYLCANVVLDEAHILNLAVHKDFRQLGIASFMVRQMIETMRDQDCRSVFLEVRASNEEALKMYEKIGFRFLGTRKNYYVSPAEDAVVMVLRLKE